MGRRPLILQRGYGARRPLRRPRRVQPEAPEEWTRVGDEGVLLARSLPECAVVAFPDRWAAAHWAAGQGDWDTVLLDDGFQHRRLGRDLDLVVLPRGTPLPPRLLPLGRLREPPEALRRADALLVPGGAAPAWLARVGAPETIETTWQFEGFTELDGAEARPDPEGPWGAMAAIGRPDLFLADLRARGLEVVWWRWLPDHHPLQASDLRALESALRERGLQGVVVTAKDAVRWADRLRGRTRVLVAQGSLRWADPEARRRFEGLAGAARERAAARIRARPPSRRSGPATSR
jgi:tetraacyldisaccharide 4'-kinase